MAFLSLSGLVQLLDPQLGYLSSLSYYLTANPQFTGGATDPYSNRSGMFEAGHQIMTVTVHNDLKADW